MDRKSIEFLIKQVTNELKEFLPKDCFKFEESWNVNGREFSWNEKWECMAALYGNKICYASDCNTINLTPRQYAASKVLYALGNLTVSEEATTEAEVVIEDYLHLLPEQENELFVSLLKSDRKQSESPAFLSGNIEPWLMPDPQDPHPEQPWYTPARYFARQCVKEDSTLLTKRKILAQKVAQSLGKVHIFKRGGKKPPEDTTVLKALANISLG